MDLVRLQDVEGTRFPAGRWTRLLVGQGALQAENFVIGHSTQSPGGGIPRHAHHNEEVYLCLAGRVEVTVGEETQIMEPVSAVYIPSNVPHSLRNLADGESVILFVYSPAGLVDHWQEELEGTLK
ncbi:MAG: cupin domain-containing protein [Sphingomonadaceae bacterium]